MASPMPGPRESLESLLRLLVARLRRVGTLGEVGEVVEAAVTEALSANSVVIRVLESDGRLRMLAGPRDGSVAEVVPSAGEQEVRTALESGEAVWNMPAGEIVRRVGSDGVPIWSGLPASMLGNFIPLTAATGAVGSLGVLRDVPLDEAERWYLIAVAGHVSQVLERFGASARERSILYESDVARARLEFLAQMTNRLVPLSTGAGDRWVVLRAFAELAVPRLADACIVRVVSEEALDPIVFHGDEGLVRSVRRSLSNRRHPPVWDELRRGAVVVLRDLAEADVSAIAGPEFAKGAWPHLAGVRAIAHIPVLSDGEPVAIVSLVTGRALSDRNFDEEGDRELLAEIGRRLSVLTQGRTLLGQFRQAAEEEGALRRRMQTLQEITRAALEGLRFEDSLQRILDLVVEGAGADSGSVVVVDRDAEAFRLRAAVGDEDFLLGVEVDPSDTVLRPVLAGRHVSVVAPTEPFVPRPGIPPVGSLLAVPFFDAGEVGGWLEVSSRPGRAFDGDSSILFAAAEQLGVAVQRAHLYEREHRIADTLQRSLLPERVPDLPGVEFAARYLPGGEGLQVGGDWFEVVELPDGRLAAAVGDVVGSGVKAAAAMGQLRTAMRALALEGLGSARLLDRLGELAIGLGHEFSTAFTFVFDPATGMLRYASAGHPPALVVRRGGGTLLLEGATSTPLGVEPGTAYPEAVFALDEGDAVVLYTDGLVERRGESLDVGLGRLREAAAAGGTAREIADRLVRSLMPRGRQDDVAVLALRFVERPRRFELALPPAAASVGAFRSAFAEWLEDCGVRGDDALDVTLAVSEACSNAVEHAGPASGEIVLIAARWTDEVAVAVRDGGRWRPPSLRPDRGRGLRILRTVMDSIDVRRRAGGTEVRMRRSLGVRV